MIYVFVITLFLYIFYNISHINVSASEIETLIRETHQYSGIHEETYGLFYVNIKLAVKNKSDMFLYKAIHHLNNIPLYMSPIDPDIQEDIAALGQNIVVATERMIMKNAINTNTPYTPKYI